MNPLDLVTTNHTGIALAPARAKETVEGAEEGSVAGDSSAILRTRQDFAHDAPTLGTVPPPPTLRGAVEGARQALEGEHVTIFIDKLGERLAFERSGTRFYEALIAKFEPFEGGPTLDELEEIHDDELAHFTMLSATIQELGADPTVVTPSADVTAVASTGLPQVLGDPRTSFSQCLDAILIAELADNDGWMMLIELADEMGHEEIADRFRDALADEEDHLVNVRKWVRAAIQASPGVPIVRAHH